MTAVLVAGASGVVGRAAAAAFAAAGWTVYGLSRRDPGIPGCQHLAVDLGDADGARAALTDLPITHLVYAALFELPGLVPGWREERQMQTNLAMLRHCVEPLLGRGRLRHVSLLQGTKAYGAHVHPMRVPGREREPRDDHANFYWLHEDWLKLRQGDPGQHWALTIWRPPVIIGHADGAPMNVLSAIGAYGALCHAAGEPMAFPGGACGVLDAVDSRLLADALVWATDGVGGVREAAANETFNVTNGDVFVWPTLWPALARVLRVDPGEPTPRSLSAWLRDRADAWDRLRAEEQLQAPGLTGFVGDSDVYLEMLLNTGGAAPPPPTLLSTVKLRQAGFSACRDTEDCLVDWLQRMRRARVLP